MFGCATRLCDASYDRQSPAGRGAAEGAESTHQPTVESVQSCRTPEERKLPIMGRIVATENVSLDGVMQGPASVDEDPRGGFTEGGWAVGFDDPAQAKFMGDGMASTKAMLFGHRTYDQLVGYWLSVTTPNPFSGIIRDATKYVCSRSADTTLPHPNSVLLAGDAIETVKRLRDEVDGDIAMLGSGVLFRSLLRAGLIDALVVQTFPIVVGSGVKLFDEGARIDLELTRFATTGTGVQLAEYAVMH